MKSKQKSLAVFDAFCKSKNSRELAQRLDLPEWKARKAFEHCREAEKRISIDIELNEIQQKYIF